MIYIGIDPGLTGAVASFEGGRWNVYDMPTLASGKGFVKLEVDAHGLARLLASMKVDDAYTRVLLERTSAMPGQGVASMFSMGVTRGVILGVLGTLAMDYHEVAPVTWKRHFDLIGADKNRSRTLALQRAPYLAAQLARVKDHNRAEAVLLGIYLQETS